MVIKLGINGFGRIGRVIFRTCLQRPDFEVTAINDPAIDIEYICYLIKYDSTHGKLQGSVSFSKNEISIDEKKVIVLHEKLPVNIPWFSVGVQYVIEASGMFTNVEKASKHEFKGNAATYTELITRALMREPFHRYLSRNNYNLVFGMLNHNVQISSEDLEKGHLKSIGVKRVIVTAPSVDIPMLIVGVNEDMIGIEHSVLSCASSTLYCLAPIVKILEDNFGVTEGFITSIHAMTPSLKPLDGLCLRGKHWRDHRSIHQNIIPAATGACKALNKIIPQIKNKLSGLAFRVPIVNVSVLDMSIRLNMNTSIEEIIKCVHQYGNTTMKDIIKISNDESVSSDFLGEEHSCILDANSSFQLSSNFFKLVCWYENERSYAFRVIDIILFSERQYQRRFSPINIAFRSSRGTTTDRCRSVFVANNYRFEINPNMISSASQDTGFKMKLLPTSFNNNTLGFRYSSTTQTTLSKVVKKTNEVLKKNYDIDVTTKYPTHQNVSSFLQSCVQLEPTNISPNKCEKNQEELHRVKQEFSKMITLTEDLLKKSCHSRNQLNQTVTNIITEKEARENNEDLNEVKTKESKFNDDIHMQIPLVVGDFEVDKHKNEHLNISEIDVVLNKTTENKLDTTETGDSFINNTCIDKILLNPIIQNSLSNNKFKQNDTFEINSIPSISEVAMSENNFIDQTDISENENCSNTKLLGQPKEIICNLLQVINNQDTIITEINKKQDVVSPEITEKCDNMMNICPLEIHNVNIVNPDNKCGIVNQDYVTENEINEYFGVQNTKMDTKTELSNDSQSNQKILESILRKISINRVELRSEETLRCDSSCYSSLSHERISKRRNKQDIYDKLDSASASDSENSFEINERKSQIIHITDLTNSVEDLARLDKICRIIEISDELSDKLFSTLNKSQCLNSKEKSWSFKDLCERIKLDEFCTKVFGK